MAQYLGRVIGAGKMDKTVKVAVTSLQLHPVILKVRDKNRPNIPCFHYATI